MENEIFKPINGYEGYYEVSNLGRVKSLARKWSVGIKKDTILKNGWSHSGYLNVTLCVDKIKRCCLVHRLVAEHFCYKPDGCNDVNHLNSNKHDNRAENLEWTTPSGNALHGFRYGNRRATRGENSGSSVITKYDVFKIRELYKNGNISQQQLANIYGICQTQIGRIIRKERWSHIQ